MKITSIEHAVRSGPFRRFSRFRVELVKHLYSERVERSDQTDDDLIARINAESSLENLQGFLDLLINPALAFIEYKEFVIATPDQAAQDELKKMVAPFWMHKGTLIEPIEFKGKAPIKFRVVAYDHLITRLKALYSTVPVAVGA